MVFDLETVRQVLSSLQICPDYAINIPMTKNILLLCALMAALVVPAHKACADFHPGIEGVAAFIANTSAQNQFDSPAWGGSAYVYYSPSLFWGFIGVGPRVTYTRLDSKTNSNNSAQLWDGLLGLRLSYDELLENFVLDIQLDSGVAYFKPTASAGGDSSLHFSYALGGKFRYHIFPRTSVGIFGRWHQALGTMKPSTSTSFKNLNFYETGLLLELAI